MQARLDDTYSTILVAWNTEISLHGPLQSEFPCALVLAAPALALMGNADTIPTCIFLDPMSLSITLGYGFALAPGMSVSFLPNSISALDGMSNVTEAEGIIVEAPSNGQPPVGVVQGPQTAGPCDSVTLDASGSMGAGSLNFKWSCSNHEELHQMLSVQTSSTVTLTPAELPQSDYSYTIRMTVSDFTGRKAPPEALVLRKLSQPIPPVRIDGASKRTVSPSSAVVLTGGAEFSQCVGRVMLAFEWHQITGEGRGLGGRGSY